VPPPHTDRFEPNNRPTAATDLGRVVRTHLPKLEIPAGDEDWFRLQTAASGQLTVTATPEEAGVALRLELWNEAGTVLLASGTDLRNAAGQVVGQQIQLTSPAGRTYLARVVPGPTAVAGGPSRYGLDVQSLTADLGTQVHDVQAGSLGAGDEAYYLLAAPAAGSLEVTLTSGPDVQGELNLEVLDANNQTVLATGQFSGSPGPGETAHASLAVQPGQVVLVHVLSGASTRRRAPSPWPSPTSMAMACPTWWSTTRSEAPPVWPSCSAAVMGPSCPSGYWPVRSSRSTRPRRSGPPT
jgi:hypothetical protein